VIDEYNAFTIVLALLMISMIINLYLTLKVKSLNEQLKQVNSNINVTYEELRSIRQRLEAMKGKM
jgi:di/tricarboxylate transporter